MSSKQQLVDAINAHVQVPAATAQSAPVPELMAGTSVSVDGVSVVEALPENAVSPLVLRRLAGLQLLAPPPSSLASGLVQEIEALLSSIVAASDSEALLEALQVHAS